MPNVTAIDWKQAGVKGPSVKAPKAAELHGSEARAAFVYALSHCAARGAFGKSQKKSIYEAHETPPPEMIQV